MKMRDLQPAISDIVRQNPFLYPWVRITLSCVAGVCLFGRVTHCELAPAARETYLKLPLTFEANRGQMAPSVQFLARGPGYSLALTQTEAVMAMSRHPKEKGMGAVLRMKVVGANKKSAVIGRDPLEGTLNYFHGNDRAKWESAIPTFGRVQYHEVYPGIDLIYHGNERQLEYDFVLAPGSDAKTIALRFEGADKVEIAPGGDLVLHVGDGEIRQPKPIAYQEVNGARKGIASRYVKHGAIIGFALGEYDPTQPVVIDPTVVYSSYLGGAGQDYGRAIAVDSSGSIYVTGYTYSLNFPILNPFQVARSTAPDAFITKISPDGQSLVYSTYLGGSGTDQPNSIAVDSAGNAYITGSTSSANFPTQSAFQPNDASTGATNDAFVTKLSANGQSLIYSTYLGGTASDIGWGIAVDPTTGNAYVCGVTFSTNFPTSNPMQPNTGGSYDAFVSKFSASGSLLFSTYFGGSGEDDGFGIALDASANAYVTGLTYSTNFPTSNPFQPTKGTNNDAFLLKMSSNGQSLGYSTYLGGDGSDSGSSIAVDSSSNAYVTGTTKSTNFPTVNPFKGFLAGDASTNGFVSKFDTDGQSLVYSTYLRGSTGNDFNFRIAVNSSGNAYLTGDSESGDFPMQNELQIFAGFFDPFVMKLSVDGHSLVYSTYLGGIADETGTGIALDSSGNAYVTGHTRSNDFPVKNAFQPTSGSPFDPDAFVAKLNDTPPPPSGDRIAFVSTREGNQGIFLMNGNGTGQTRLTTGADSHPSLSGNGARITFETQRGGSGNDIWVMNADGSNQTQITSNAEATQPSFSPDGTRITFLSQRAGGFGVYIMNADGSNQTQLTTDSSDTWPSFSPDGTRIVFASYGGIFNNDIYIMNSDGSNRVRLTTNSASDSAPSFSPDGTRIAFQSTRDSHDEIYVMNADGSNQTRVTNNGSKNSLPSFSADSTRIAFTTILSNNPPDIFAINPDGTNEKPLTNNYPLPDAFPNWGHAATTLPPTPTQVVSRKLHNGAPFDINLPLTGTSGVECRSGGATNNYQIVLTFPSAVTFNSAAVTAGTGAVSGSSGSGTTNVTVDLTGVTNAQRITVRLLAASDGTNTGNLDVEMGLLLSDTTGNGTVNASDVGQTKLQSGQAVTGTNFRTDVNATGSINGTDVSLVKLKAGTALP
jgi:beta-propeller repeat-containing protein/WD40 repeat protein